MYYGKKKNHLKRHFSSRIFLHTYHLNSKQVLTKILAPSSYWADRKLELWVSSYFTMLADQISVSTAVFLQKRKISSHFMLHGFHNSLWISVCFISVHRLRVIFSLLIQSQRAELACALAVLLCVVVSAVFSGFDWCSVMMSLAEICSPESRGSPRVHLDGNSLERSRWERVLPKTPKPFSRSVHTWFRFSLHRTVLSIF